MNEKCEVKGCDCEGKAIVNLNKYQILQEIKSDVFTLIQIRDTETQITGTGIARKSDNDKWNKKTAIQIASGRAIKATELKKKKKLIHELLLG